jgi:hypothetical protein
VIPPLSKPSKRVGRSEGDVVLDVGDEFVEGDGGEVAVGVVE